MILDNTNILYCFISHKSEIKSDYLIISNMMESLNYDHYILVCGGDTNTFDNHILYLDCDDSYSGLPEKINKLYKYISKMQDVNYLTKLDRTVTLKRLVDPNLVKNKDYCGQSIRFINHPKASSYHFNKCSADSSWRNKLFFGKEIHYCLGGSYILSKKAIQIIANDNSYREHIYEDYYVGLTLHNNNINPHNITLKEYFYDINHLNIYG